MNNRILILGNGGHAKGVIQALKQKHPKEALGVVTQNAQEVGETFMDIAIVGTDDDLPELFCEGWQQAVLGVGSLTNTIARTILTKTLKKIGFCLPAVIDESCRIGEGVVIGAGSYLACGCIVQSGVRIGETCILNTGCIIEHDCEIADFAHVSSGAILLGNVKIGAHTLIGGGSVVRQGITIGSQAVIGAGSTVVRDMPNQCTAYGNPCKIRSEA